MTTNLIRLDRRHAAYVQRAGGKALRRLASRGSTPEVKERAAHLLSFVKKAAERQQRA
jgi:hypothetical protein